MDKWNNFYELVGTWTALERDSIGYLHYFPCDGKTPQVEIFKDSLVLKHQIENPTTFHIDSTTVIKDRILIHASSNNLNAEFDFKIVTTSAQFILFKWRYLKLRKEGKKILTREHMAQNFRQLKNTCETEKVPEIQFLLVEFK